MKAITTIRMEKEILQKAQELGLNVSKVCENSLKIYVQALTNTNQSMAKGSSPVLTECSSSEENSLVRSPGFEPGIASLKDLRTVSNLKIDWEAFEAWMLRNGKGERWARYLTYYARPYAECMIKGDLSKLRDLPDSQRSNALKGLSALSKYLGIHEQFTAQFKNLGFKWGGRKTDDLIIDRLNKVNDPDEIFEWIRQVKAARPDLEDFMDLMAITGLRFVEGIECYNLIIQLANGGRLSEYYNEKTRTLEHFRFKELFIRNTKKAFISFVPADLVKRISENSQLTSRDSVQKLVQKKGLKIKFSYIRESHGTFLTKYLKEPEIDFLHGRVGSNVFMRNYFNPALIVDLESRTFQGIKEIQGKLQ